ncbi:BON domain-containing protein [Paraburkholderia youngii]|uniref:BON domain-containing protein n=1 Tax=Paraburkholderia youngii TaxID=2782701 RepID=UPI003D216AE6
MKVNRTLKLASGALIAVASINAWPQGNESAATSTKSSTTAAPSKSDIRKANGALSNKVLRALTKGGVDTSHFTVLVKGSAVTLAGHVPDNYQIEKAGNIAKDVPGVTSVTNALAIHD